MNTQIIAIANQKGGVGKTTTCANLGIGLAQAGKKVLLIDGDPQGSLTISLGYPQPDKLPFTLSDAMGRILMDEPLRPGEGILHHPEGVDLMPADIQLSGMEVSLVNAMSRETILRQYLDTVKGQYSHILIDCQPSLGMLTVNALAAANIQLCRPRCHLQVSLTVSRMMTPRCRKRWIVLKSAVFVRLALCALTRMVAMRLFLAIAATEPASWQVWRICQSLSGI